MLSTEDEGTVAVDDVKAEDVAVGSVVSEEASTDVEADSEGSVEVVPVAEVELSTGSVDAAEDEGVDSVASVAVLDSVEEVTAAVEEVPSEASVAVEVTASDSVVGSVAAVVGSTYVP